MLRNPLRNVRPTLSFALLCISIYAATGSPRPAAAQDVASQREPQVTRDVPYTTDSTGSYRADLYQPAAKGLSPALILIHGGSWRSGHKTELRKLALALAAHGYVCFSIDYDTHPRSFPYSWQESRAAVAFVRSHAAAYGVDPTRIGVLGTSAGGQLAALVAVAPQGPAQLSKATADSTPGDDAAPAANTTAIANSSAAAAAPTTIPIAAAVIYNGGYDLHPEHYLLRRYLGGRCETIPAVCNDASPDDHMHPGIPPIFVGHGTSDHLIPYSQATGFIDRLRAAGDPVTPFAATGAGHSYWRSHKWYGPNLDATEQFLSQVLPPPVTGAAVATDAIAAHHK